MAKVNLFSQMVTDSRRSQPSVKLDIEKQYVEKIRTHPLRIAIRDKPLDAISWQKYGTERYLAARSFMPLLRSSYAHANTALRDQRLAGVLEQNIKDELGESVGADGSHEEWRLDFYDSIGISADLLATAKPSSAAISYRKTLERAATLSLIHI